jgi:SAM-dependent methyltransferase
MSSVEQHYDQHLAEHYSWLFGGLPERARENRELFEKLGLRSTTKEKALDVGAGSGFQSIPLAELGYAVTAVDLSAKLLEELARNRGDLPVETVRKDILELSPLLPSGSFAAAVCMGDTLTHLGSFGDVQRLLREVHRVLSSGGAFVVAMRDYTKELRGEERFIPVRADDKTVFSCFLEYEGDHVRVYDVIHSMREDKGWDMRVSSYKKLRIAPDWLEKRARETGFEVVSRDGVVVLRKA